MKMKRGVIQVTLQEVLALTQTIDITKYKDMPLFEKLQSALKSGPETSLELSEDEIESMLDEIMIPSDNEKPEITSLRGKFNQKLLEFRKDF